MHLASLLSSTSYRHRLVEASEVIHQNQRMEKEVVEHVRLVFMPGVAQQKQSIKSLQQSPARKHKAIAYIRGQPDAIPQPSGYSIGVISDELPASVTD